LAVAGNDVNLRETKHLVLLGLRSFKE